MALILLFISIKPVKASPKLPVTYIISFNFVSFRWIIFFAKPTDVTVKDVIFENVVSPPLNKIWYFLSSFFKELIISIKLECFAKNLFMEAEINIYLGFTPLQIKSEIDDLIIFLIIKSGWFKFL